jgi:hypothetical protein
MVATIARRDRAFRSRVVGFALLTVAASCSTPAEPTGSALDGDWASLGLQNQVVTVLTLRGAELSVGTDNGVYRAVLGAGAPTWSHVGLEGRSIKSLLVLGADTTVAAVAISGMGADTVSLHRTIDGGHSWHSYQNGFGGATESRAVFALAALPGPPAALLATGRALVVAKSDDVGQSWRRVWGDWQLGAAGTHFVVAESQHAALVWAGGESGRFQPFLLKSTDSGESWQEIWLQSGGDNACYTLALDPLNPDVLYTGMEGRVVKTTDGGMTWETVLQPDSYPYFFGLGVSRVTPSRVYAAGARQGLAGELQELTLYASRDSGNSWVTSTNGSVRDGVRALLVWKPTRGAGADSPGDGGWPLAVYADAVAARGHATPDGPARTN